MPQDEYAAIFGKDQALPKPLLGCRTVEEAIEAMTILEELREEEGSEIGIICDNPDFGVPNSAVMISFDFAEFPTQFHGDTVLEALRAALVAKKARDGR